MNRRISIKELFGAQYVSLWEQYVDQPLVDRGYDIVDHLYIGSLLFVGLNPATGKDITEERIFEEIVETSYPKYYGPLSQLSHDSGFNGSYSYIDLLGIRCTSQKTIKEYYFSSPTFKEFCYKQLHLSIKAMELAKPKVVIVCNAYARELLKGSGFLKITFDNRIGTYRIINNESLKGTPVFLSGMISGQHALDVGSRERLAWHVNEVVKRSMKDIKKSVNED